MKTSSAVGLTIGVLFLALIGISIEALALGLILSWFGVSLAFWQNLIIILLANAIFNNSSSK